MNTAKKHIPLQQEGEENNVESIANCTSPAEAHKLYLLVKDRLKDIGNWKKFTGAAASTFAITDTAGNVAYKMAEKGDVFYIDMPGPGTIAGGGYDWVRIENMEEQDDAEGVEEYIVITVRPVANPQKQEQGVAHFFDHKSTNTFIVTREGSQVLAGVYGRNEMPNTDGNLIDKARNVIVGLTARHGLSGPHWQVFVENLLKAE